MPPLEDTKDGACLVAPQAGLAVFSKPKWWRNTFSFCLSFAPKCIKPAAIIMAMVLVMLSTVVAESLLLQQANLGLLFVVLALNFFALIGALALLVWGFASWLSRLTGFALAFNQTPQSQFLSEKIDLAASKLTQLQSIQETDKRKAHLAKYWTGLSLFLTLPSILFIVPFCISLYASYVPAYLAHAQTAPTMPLPPVPEPVAMICTVASLIFGTYIMVLTLAGIVISASTDLQPGPAVMHTIKLSHIKILPLSLITVAMLSITLAISAPREILQHFVAMPWAENNIFVMFGEEIWRCVTSVILTTFTLAPFCEYLRSKPK